MSDNIDYDELDKAVTAAIDARNTAKAQTKAESKPISSRAPQKPAAMPAHRGTVMDFAPRRSSSIVHTVSIRKTIVRPVAKPAARPAPINRLVNRPAARPVAHTVARPTVAPAKVVKPAPRPVPAHPAHPAQANPPLKKVVKPAPAPTVAKPVLKPASAAPAAPVEAPKPALKKREAPNGNNYSLGGRSPFIANTKVEKHPLGSDIPETSTSALRSTRNVYSQKSPTRATENTGKHIVTQDSNKKSNWIWTLIVLGVIAAGGAIGYLAYLFIFPHN